MARTDWTSKDTVRPADMNDIGEEINQLKNELENIPDASLTEKGIVQLSNATNGTRENVAPTEKALKLAYDQAAKNDGFGTTDRFANDEYRLTTQSGYPNELIAGTRVTARINSVNTTTNPTLNVNGLGLAEIKKSNGKAFKVGELRVGSVYTLVYDGISTFFLQGDEGGDYNVGDTITSENLELLSTDSTNEWRAMSYYSAWGVAVDNKGAVYLSQDLNTSASSIRKLNAATGAVIWQLNSPVRGQGLAVDPFDYLYCTHFISSGKAIRKLSTSGGAEVWGDVAVPYAVDVATDNDGFVFVVHQLAAGNKTVRRLNGVTASEMWANTDVANPLGVAVNGRAVYVAYNDAQGGKTLRKLNADSGAEVWSDAEIRNGSGVAVDGFGNVYCVYDTTVGSKTIRKIRPSGSEVWSKSDIGNVISIDVDEEGNSYTASNESSKKYLRKLDPQGNEVWRIDITYKAAHVAVDYSGAVYVPVYAYLEKYKEVNSYKIKST